MHRVALGLVILVIGCTSDPSLDVTVVQDPAIAAVVAKSVVSIYVKPGLACAEIEFGDVPSDELAGALVTEAETGWALVGIPRVDDKLVVARGYAADGTLVSAGCATLGVVDGPQTLAITTVPTATVAVGLDAASARGLLVSTTDATNASIDGRVVDWRLFGAAGTSADSTMFQNIAEGVWQPLHPTCTTDGDATVHPMPPLLPGGYELQLRVSWATRPPPLFSAFTQIDKSSMTMSTIASSKIIAPCALERHGGTTKIACFSNETTVDILSYAPDTRTLARDSQQGLPVTTDAWVALISVDEVGGDKSVYAISDQGTWQAIDGAPAAATGTWCGPVVGPLRCGSYTTTGVQVVPACGDQPAYLLGSSTDVGAPNAAHLRIQPIRGGAPAEYDLKDGALVGAGCMTELQPDGSSKVRQAVVVNLPKTAQSDPFTAVELACSATKTPCTVALPSQGQAITFADTAAGEHQLIGTTFDATGAQLARWVVEPAAVKGGSATKDRLIERSRQVAAASPRQLVSGQFDADGEPDLMWSFATRAAIDFQLAYARDVLGAPLSALATIDTPAALTPQPLALFAADFNGDKFDEIVMVFATTVLATTATTLVVVPTGLPYANPPSPTSDPACP